MSFKFQREKSKMKVIVFTLTITIHRHIYFTCFLVDLAFRIVECLKSKSKAMQMVKEL